jgi:integrase
MTYDGLSVTKSKKSRPIPVTDHIDKLLGAQSKRQKKYKELMWNEYNKSDFVVTYDDGKLIDPRTFSKRYKSILLKSGLPFVRFQDLRHTTASLLIMEGVDLKTVAEILGHSSIKITADTYGHIAEEHKLGALNKLDKYVPVK